MSALTTPAEPSPAASAGTGRPLRRDAERNRQRILAAAQELFAERGLDVTLDDIAHHAGLGVGTVYRRFPSREHLVEVLFEQRIDELAAHADDALIQADSWQGLVDFLTHAAEAMAVNRGLHEVMVSSAYGHDRTASARERLTPTVSRLIARAQADGHLRPDFDTGDLVIVHVMLGAVAEYSQHVQPRLWRRYLALLLDGLRTERDTPSPLPEPALDEPAIDEAMRCWRPGRR
jgi:AcrR family transcriptional regulator